MGVRPAEDLGVDNLRVLRRGEAATDSGEQGDIVGAGAPAEPSGAPAPAAPPAPRDGEPSSADAPLSEPPNESPPDTSSAEAARRDVRGEPRALAQFAVPPKLFALLTDCQFAFEYASRWEHLADMTTIVGGVLWARLDHRDAKVRAEVRDAVLVYLKDPISRDRHGHGDRVGAYLPLSVRQALKGTSVWMRRDMQERGLRKSYGSMRVIVCALLFAAVGSGNARQVAQLIEPYAAASDPLVD